MKRLPLNLTADSPSSSLSVCPRSRLVVDSMQHGDRQTTLLLLLKGGNGQREVSQCVHDCPCFNTRCVVPNINLLRSHIVLIHLHEKKSASLMNICGFFFFFTCDGRFMGFNFYVRCGRCCLYSYQSWASYLENVGS